MSLHETRKLRNAVIRVEMEEMLALRDEYKYLESVDVRALEAELETTKRKLSEIYNYVKRRATSAEISLRKRPNNREALGKLDLCHDILKEIDDEPTRFSKLLETYSNGGENGK